MATQIVGYQSPVAVPMEERTLRQRAQSFFSAVADTLRACFAPGAGLGVMDSQYRAKLSEREKAHIDASFMGMC